MNREILADLQAFVTVARERSFTRAAAQIGVSRSALSHAMTALEQRLGLQLLTRTTRSVSTTEAGARLLATLEPRLTEIDDELAALAEFRERPAGLVRISAPDFAISTVLWPRLLPLLRDHPDIRIELCSDNRMTDIVAERFDAGVRAGHHVARNMVSVLISPDEQMAVVAAPAYLAGRQAPQLPADLSQHTCISLRLPTYDGLQIWDLVKDGLPCRERVEGRFVFSSIRLTLDAALDGMGIAYVPLILARPYLETGRLLPLLQPCWPTFSGYLYYPTHRQSTPAFDAVVEALRYRDPTDTDAAEGGAMPEQLA